MHEQISTRLSKEAKKWKEIVFEMFIFQKIKVCTNILPLTMSRFCKPVCICNGGSCIETFMSKKLMTRLGFDGTHERQRLFEIFRLITAKKLACLS